MTRRLRRLAPLVLAALGVTRLALAAPPAAIPAPPDVAAPPADATAEPSGLASKVITPGTDSAHPGPTDFVKVHYTGWTTDGKMFDSSVPGKRPLVFSLDKVITGFHLGLQLMSKGETRRLWIPAKLAYEGVADRPQGMLVFDVELLDFRSPPEVPADVAAVPDDAERAKSGLAWKVLRAGNGTAHPSAKSIVEVHYSGWTTDGQMFDSSVTRVTTSKFPLTGVIKGWTEGLQLMTEGEVRRLWIPEKLAYRGELGKPAGMLVFDIELVKIVKP